MSLIWTFWLYAIYRWTQLNHKQVIRVLKAGFSVLADKSTHNVDASPRLTMAKTLNEDQTYESDNYVIRPVGNPPAPRNRVSYTPEELVQSSIEGEIVIPSTDSELGIVFAAPPAAVRTQYYETKDDA